MPFRTITASTAAADAACAAGFIVRLADAHNFDPVRAAVADRLVDVARAHGGDLRAIAAAIAGRLPFLIAEAEKMLQAERADSQRIRT